MRRLAYLVSHPIQYQAPLLRYIAKHAEFALEVWYLSDFSVRSYMDAGFGRQVSWDSDLTSGYPFEVLPGWGSHNKPTFYRPVSRTLATRIDRSRIDALWLHGWASNVNLRALFLARSRGIPTLIRSESHSGCRPTSILGKVSEASKPLLLRQFDGYLSIGSRNMDWYLKNGVAADRIFSVPYAVDNAAFQAAVKSVAPNREKLRHSFGFAPGRPIVLFASKMQRRKRPSDLLSAWTILPVEHRPYLLFVGDGEERRPLEQQVSQQNLEGVRFVGFRNQSEMPALYDLCDVFVLPSEREPWGLVINEVLNAARPVIVSDEVGCGPDLVREAQTGYVVKVGDVVGLAGRINRLTSDAPMARSMGAAGRCLVDSWNFSQDTEGLLAALDVVCAAR